MNPQTEEKKKRLFGIIGIAVLLVIAYFYIKEIGTPDSLK
jgi:hypothetical protein